MAAENGSDDKTGMKGIIQALFVAPLIFACHVLEEAPRFVEWVNSHLERGISAELFWNVNITGGVITVMVVGLVWLFPLPFSLLIVAAWLSFLMFANALFHIIATLADGAYTPGVVTATVLYLPYFAWVLRRIVQSRQVRWEALLGAGIIGACPMLVHGYRILFLGSRLF